MSRERWALANVLIASVPLMGTMLVAIGTVHWRYGCSAVNTIGLGPSGPIFGPPGYEVNLLYIAALLTLCGRYERGVGGRLANAAQVAGARRGRGGGGATTSTSQTPPPQYSLT